tara:strand:+ start:62 stop:253 length:192 start_codon:yes stop_codon:yes gene_type:complete
MNDQDKMIIWLQKDIDRNKTIMNEIIYIYSDIEDILKKYNIEFKYDFKIILIKLSAYLYKNSL